MNLKLALRSSHIPRWGIVDMQRTQSVAEHQYRVWLIAMALYDSLYDDSINSFDRASVTQYALTHDLEEVMTGDIPTPIKKQIPATVMDSIEQDIGNVLGPEAIALRRGVRGTVVECVVKIADLVESMLYLRAYAVDKQHMEEVYDGLDIALGAKLDELQSGKYLIHRIDKFEGILDGLLD